MMQASLSVLMLGAIAAEPAQHRQMKFNCYVSADNAAPVALYEKPDVKAKIVKSIPPGNGMLTTIDRVKHRGDWMYVQWGPELESKEKPRKGWIRYPDVTFGECED